MTGKCIHGFIAKSAPLVSLLLVLTKAHAEPSATDKAAAEALFDQGKELLRASRLDEACPKFAESQRLDPGVGTLLHLGDCYERTGRLASAWATFREASALARVGGDTKRDALAQQRFAKLEPLLPRLSVNVTEVPGLVVTDGASTIAKASFGLAMPVDPGDHVVRASAAGYQDFQVTVHVGQGERQIVDVPALTKVAPPPEPARATKPDPAPPPLTQPETPRNAEPQVAKRHVSTPTLVSFGVAGAGIAAGTIFGVMSLSSTSSIKSACANNVCPSSRADDLSGARTNAWISDVGFGVAIVGAAVGTYFLLGDLGQKGAPSTSRFVAPDFSVSHEGYAMGLRGRF